MAWEPEIWTGEVRRVLYRRLVVRFGPYVQWAKRHSPGGKLDAEFEEFCQAFAIVVGAKSAKAVQHQIRFAMPETEKGSAWGRHSQTAILNKSAALEAGFIEDRHLPDLLATGRAIARNRKVIGQPPTQAAE